MIIYRNYEPGDEKRLVELYNSSFTIFGFETLRTEKIFKWAFTDRPFFTPNQIQTAFDSVSRQIIGMLICCNEPFWIENKQIFVGNQLNLAISPEFRKRHIAITLFEKNVENMRHENIPFCYAVSSKRGYHFEGYQLADNLFAGLLFADLRALIRYLPFLLPGLPALLAWIYLPMLLLHFKLKRFNNVLQKAGCCLKIIHPGQPNYISFALHFRTHVNINYSRIYEGFWPYSVQDWINMRIKVPSKMHMPSYILLTTRDGTALMGASIMSRIIYFVRLGLRIKLAIISEYFINESAISDILPEPESIHKISLLFLANLQKIAQFRGCAAVFLCHSEKLKIYSWAFKRLSGFDFSFLELGIHPNFPDTKLGLNLHKPLFNSGAGSTGYR